MVEKASTIWADGPSSSPDQPAKPLIREWGTWIEGIITAFTSNGGLIYVSKALIDADLAHDANTMAWVIDGADSGIYLKTGLSGSGSWTRVSDLPFSFIIASDAGAGGPNAIVATSPIPVSASALILMNIAVTNTGSPVTVAFNGGAAITIKTNSGNDVVAGGLSAGMIALGCVSGQTFRLASDQASAAIVAATEGWANIAQAASEAALSAVPNAFPPNRPTMAAYNTTIQKNAMLTEYGREGQFEWDPSNLSTKVTADAEQIGFVAPTSDPTGSTGAWRRNLKLSRLYPEMGGVFGDDVPRVDAYLAMQKIIDFAAREKSVLHLSAGGIYRLDGFLLTRSGLWIESEPGAILRPTEWSIYKSGAGAFFSNVVSTVTPDLNVQSNIRLDVAIDGSMIPAPTFDYAVSSTANTVTLPATFDGKIRAGISRLTVLFGTGIGENKIVTAWNPATRVATVNSNWVAPPDATSFIGEGANDNAFGGARGLYNSDIRVVANDFMTTGLLGGSGGKGAGFEKGCRNIDVEVIAERCGWAGWVQGVPGTFPGYSPENQAAGNDRQWARDIRMSVRAKDCQSAFGLWGIRTGGGEDPDGSGNSSFVVADVMARNCGHAVTRAVGSLRNVKSGVVTIAGGSNARITLDSVIDADFAPVWPDAPFVGNGESGTIGSVVQGWGQDVTIDARHVGACDSLYNLDRCRAMYDDASPTGIIQKVYGLNVKIKHEGSQPANGLLWQQGQLGNVPTDQITANFEFDTNYHPSKICGLNVGYLNINLKVRSHATASSSSPRGVEGTANRIKNEYNDLTLAAGVRNLQGLAFGDGLPIRHIKTATLVWDPGTIANLAEATTTVSVPGVAAGSNVQAFAKYNGGRSTSTSLEAEVTANDTVTLYWGNFSGSIRTPGSRTFFVTVITYG